MTARIAAVLRPGDRVRYDGADHVAVALAGTSVRLRSDDRAELVVLASHLMACPEFTVTGSGPLPEVEPSGLLESLPAGVLGKARELERHVVEVLTGLLPDPPPGAVPRAGFDPAVTTLAQRDRAKAAELGVTVRMMQARRARYARQGLWGLVDQRAARQSAATGRADARLVAVIRDLVAAETDASTGTRLRLIRRAVKAVEAAYGPGVVPLPGRTTFYKVIDAVAAGRHTFGSAVTRRQAANRPQGPFTPSSPPGRVSGCRSTPPRWTCGWCSTTGCRVARTGHRGRPGHPHDRRGGAAADHQGSGRGAAAGPGADPRADAAGLGRWRCGCRRSVLPHPGWPASTPGWRPPRPGR